VKEAFGRGRMKLILASSVATKTLILSIFENPVVGGQLRLVA
jgi:hypothetical protein